jgi:hypothetical protein
LLLEAVVALVSVQRALKVRAAAALVDCLRDMQVLLLALLTR